MIKIDLKYIDNCGKGLVILSSWEASIYCLFKSVLNIFGEDRMKHIVLYSGGCASAYAAYLVAQKQRKEDIILLHTATYSEHKDADRFRNEVAKYLGLKVENIADGRNIWKLIDDNQCLPSQFIPFCTRILKQEQSEKFYKTLKEDYILYFGYGTEEWGRIQKQYARFELIGRKTRYPIFEKNILNEEIKRIIKEEWKIKLPQPYKHLKHNNCIPCFKAGMREWRNYWLYYNKEFEKAKEYEEKIGHTVFKNISLKKLEEKWQNEKEWKEMQISMFEVMDNIPCTCAI